MLTPQESIASRFDRRSTAEEVLGDADLAGVNAVVTGGYSGIGLETVRLLARRGASVVVPARDMAKAAAALAGMANVRALPFDLSDPRRLEMNDRSLHLLIANAGIMATPLLRDRRGNELQLSTNHLGHFHLTAQLWPALVRGARERFARVVVLSSGAHRFGGIDFDDPNYENRPYDPWKAYAQSKTANALFALELDRRGAEQGIRAFSVHPGVVTTDLQRHMTPEIQENLGNRDAIEALRKTIPQGAATTMWCATSDDLAGRGGVYCEDCNIARAVPEGDSSLEGILPWARDPELAERLWQMSEELTDIRWPST